MSFLNYAVFILLTVWNPILQGSLATSLFSDTFLERNSNEPEFVEDIKNVTVPAGREAVLSCNVANLSRFKVGWIRAEDQTILTLDTKVVTHNGRVTVTHDGAQTWNLHLRQIRENDRGCYMCQINTAIMKKQLGCVDVHVSPTIIDEETSADLTVREGENVTLVCKATGRPKPKIIWRREDGKSIMMRRGLRDVYKGHDQIAGDTIQFIRMDRRQMGSFFCIASNDVPPAKSKRIVLDVNFPPLVKVQNQLLGAPYGSNLTLVCEIQAMPKPFVYWKMVNRGEMLIDGLVLGGLKNSSKYTIEEKRESYKVSTSLTIRNFGQKDVGIYQCISTNSLGKSEGNIRLHEIKFNKGTSPATEHHHPVTLSGYATPPMSTEGRIHHPNNRDSLWSPYDVSPRNPVMTPHDTKNSEVGRNDNSAISSSSASCWRSLLQPSLSFLFSSLLPEIIPLFSSSHRILTLPNFSVQR